MKKFFLPLLCVLVFLSSCSEKVDIQALIAQGEDAFYEKNYVVAKSAFEKCAELGDSKGQYWLAYLTYYTSGHYSETDTLNMSSTERGKYCFDLFKKSADQNDGSGLYGMFLCYSYGIGTDVDINKALEYLDKSVKMEFARAMAEKGRRYLQGDKVEINTEKSVELFRKSSEMNDPWGQTYLGLCYLDGIVLDKDEVRGLELLKKGADRNCHDAYNILGNFYFNKEEYETAFEYIINGTNSVGNLKNLALCYYLGLGTEQNMNRGASIFHDLAEQGDAQSQYFWGICCEDGYGSSSEAYEYYLKSAMQEFPDACAKVGECLLLGKGCNIDVKEAERYLKKGAELGSKTAEQLLEQYAYKFKLYEWEESSIF